MFFRGVALASLLAAVQAQSTYQAQYNEICPSKNGQVEEIAPSYHVKYACDTKGAAGAIHTEVNSHQDCATICQNTEGCLGSTWAYNSRKCQLSTSGEPAGPYAGGLFMQWVEEDPLGVDPVTTDPLDPEQSACNQQVQELEGQVETCNASLEDSNRRVEILESGAAVCNSLDGTTVQRGGHSYKLHCSKKTHFSQYKQFTTKTFDECLEACSADAGCKYPIFIMNAKANCKFSGVKPAVIQTTSAFQILAVPTPAK